MAVRTNARGDRSRAQILAVAERLFGELGFHGASIRVVAQAASMPTASLLHHFSTKEKLYAAVLADIAADVDALIDDSLDTGGDHRVRIGLFVDAYATWCERKPSRGLLLLRELLDNRARVEGAERLILAPPFLRVRAFLADGMERGVLRRIDPTMAIVHIVGAASYFHAAEPTLSRIDGRSRTRLRHAFHVELLAMTERLLLEASP